MATLDFGEVRYTIDLREFKIQQQVLNQQTGRYDLAMEVNPVNTMHLEESSYFYDYFSNMIGPSQEYLFPLFEESLTLWESPFILGTAWWPVKGQIFNLERKKEFLINSKTTIIPDPHQNVALGIYYPTRKLYGLPQRVSTTILGTTEHTDPFSLINKDIFPHGHNNRTGLYASIPYIQTVNEKWKGEQLLATGTLWVNSAETFVDNFKINRHGV